MIRIDDCQLQFFAGFYESVYSSELDYSIEEDSENPEDWCVKLKEGQELEYDDFDIDYKGFHDAVVKSYVEIYKSAEPLDILENIENVELVSPKYYNFATDEIFGTFVLSDDFAEKLLKDIDEHKNEYKQIIHNKHTSYDGFISFMSNDIDDWIDMLKGDVESMDSRYISCLIGYSMLVRNENIYEQLNYESGVLEDICTSEFYHLTDECMREKLVSIDDIPMEQYLQ